MNGAKKRDDSLIAKFMQADGALLAICGMALDAPSPARSKRFICEKGPERNAL
jgi:hypothetical protein